MCIGIWVYGFEKRRRYLVISGGVDISGWEGAIAWWRPSTSGCLGISRRVHSHHGYHS